MDLLFGHRMSPEDRQMLQEKIFTEADTGGKGHLEFDDIQKVFWATNINKVSKLFKIITPYLLQ